MKRHLIEALLLSVSLCLAEGPMDCISEMTMPNATGGIDSIIPATVRVRVTIGKNGLARSVDYGDAKPLLRIALNQYFKEEARYVPACEGKTISFRVRFVVEGIPTPFLSSKVRFHSPDEFVVVTHPTKPSLDEFPQPRPTPNDKRP